MEGILNKSDSDPQAKLEYLTIIQMPKGNHIFQAFRSMIVYLSCYLDHANQIIIKNTGSTIGGGKKYDFFKPKRHAFSN